MAITNSSTRVTFTTFVPQALVGINSPSPSLVAEVITGAPIYCGAVPGQRFYLNEAQAYSMSNTLAGTFCHEGWYRVVQVAAGATAANIAFGYVGAQATLAGGPDVVTSYDQAALTGVDPVVFLGPVTPGNYTIVQDGGDVTLHASAAVTAGDILVATKAGNGSVVDLGSTAETGANSPGVVAIAMATIGAAGLVRARWQAAFGE